MFRSKILWIFFPVFSLLLAAGTPGLYGQSLFGTWQDSQFNITLKLNQDGTYQLQHPNGTSQGTYGVNGNAFWLQDSYGMSTVWYTILRFNQNEFILSDVNGVVINFRRQQQQPQATIPTTPAKTPSTTPTSPAKTLAEKDGLALTSHHIDTGVGLIQFIIGQAVKPSEVKELESQSIVEFNQNPSYFINEMNSLEQSLTTIRSFTDPVRIGLTRQELFSALYQATHTMRERDKPLLIQVLNRYIKVLAYDQANNLVLTDRDADGMLNYLAFNSELAGQTVTVTDSLRQSYASDLIRNFSSMPLETKQLLCSASLIWQLLDANWNMLTPAQKQQYKQAYMAQIAQTSQNSPVYDYQYESPQPRGRSSSDSMRDWNARQNMYSMMNQMNMDSHALSLNIIENIGGTGNYWSVVDY